MARCQASILVNQTVKPIEVLFSSGSGTSYIFDGTVADLGLSPKQGNVTLTVKDVTGKTYTSSQFASIDLVLGSFRHVHTALILPGGNSPYLVLGMDWLKIHGPQFDYGRNTMSITVQHTIQMKDKDEDDGEMLLIPSMRVVDVTPNKEHEKPKPLSRNQFIKKHWGNRVKFQGSYGLKMSPEGIAEGNNILEAMMRADEEEADQTGQE